MHASSVCFAHSCYKIKCTHASAVILAVKYARPVRLDVLGLGHNRLFLALLVLKKGDNNNSFTLLQYDLHRSMLYTCRMFFQVHFEQLLCQSGSSAAVSQTAQGRIASYILATLHVTHS